MNKVRLLLAIFFFTLIIAACKDNKAQVLLDRFPEKVDLTGNLCNISDESIARIEDIQCNDSCLLVFDYHSGKSFSVFDIDSGKMIARFGTIGQGANEIQLGAYGDLEGNKFYIHYDQTGYIGRYVIDSLYSNKDFPPVCVAKYKIPEAQYSRIIAMNDSTFLGAGTYNSKYQYLLFDKNNNVIDYAVKIYNAEENNLNEYHKFLSNQGKLRKRPGKNQFVYSINYSSDIDFCEVSDNKIRLIKPLRLKKPEYEPWQDGKYNRMIPLDDNVIGYIDIAPTDKYVYALYTNKKIRENGVGNELSSNIILVFDWEGNPIKQYKIDREAFYIAVDKASRKLYAAVINQNDGWSIVFYNLREKRNNSFNMEEKGESII